MSRKLIIGIIIGVLVAAVATTTFLVSKSANSIEHQLELGYKYLEEGDYEEAILAFERAIEIDKKNIEAYMGLAEAYVGNDELEDAVDVLEDLIDIDDEYKDAYELLVEILIELEDYDYALDIIDEGLNDFNSRKLKEYKEFIETQDIGGNSDEGLAENSDEGLGENIGLFQNEELMTKEQLVSFFESHYGYLISDGYRLRLTIDQEKVYWFLPESDFHSYYYYDDIQLEVSEESYFITFSIYKTDMGTNNESYPIYMRLYDDHIEFGDDETNLEYWELKQGDVMDFYSDLGDLSNDLELDVIENSNSNNIGAYIGISMPTQSSERWIKDGVAMKEILEAKGYVVELQYAEDDIPTQKAQIENMITKGATVLIIAAIDGSTLSGTLDAAGEQGVKIISYDRLLLNTDAVSYYVTFDNLGVGRLQAESLVEGLVSLKGEGPYNIELFSGAPDDRNAFYFYEGAMDVLQPLIDNGTVVVQSGQVTQEETGTFRWDFAVAQERMEGILADYYSSGEILDGVLSPYDGLSRGIISALEAFGYTGTNIPVVTGQDAEAASIKLIISGEQYSTILKDTRDIAAVAVDMVDAILIGNEPVINNTTLYNNNVKIVPSYLFLPDIVTIDNYQELIIDSGYLSADDIN